MKYNEFSKELLNEFAAHFPNIDFSDIETGYEKVEKRLLNHMKDFTLEQWQVICNSKYNYLFQVGMPHYNWRDEREYIIKRLIETANAVPCKTWNETWYHGKMYQVKTPTGVVLEMTILEPITWSSSSRTQYNLRIAKVEIPVPTHRAVIIGLGSDTRAYITDQFAGSLNECENWVAKNVAGNFFKIMEIKK